MFSLGLIILCPLLLLAILSRYSALSGRRPVRLLVSYVYHESSVQTMCEVENKRLNFAMFLKFAVEHTSRNVVFHITFQGTKPKAENLVRALGTSISDRSGVFISNALDNRVKNVKVHRSDSASTTDLCHHQRVLGKITEDFDFAMVMNDGVRGPFLRQGAPRHSSVGKFTRIPTWAAPFLSKMIIQPKIGLVGAVGSCEIDTHVQSWLLGFSAIASDIVLLHMRGTCSSEMLWQHSVVLGEVGLSVDILDHGLNIGMLYPSFPEFTQYHREAIRRGISEVREKMFNCDNVLKDPDIMLKIKSLDNLIWAKFGGEIMRQKAIAQGYVREVLRRTREILDEDTFVRMENCSFSK